MARRLRALRSCAVRLLQALAPHRGESTTSRIESRPLMIIVRRSIPMPMPPVGGMPCSSASM
jgi:hypothetical protein